MVDIVSPSSTADFLLVESRERGEVLTNLKLQKLLYYAQSWFLATHDRPLFDEDFQAWVHGPVLPSQYYRFRDFQWRPITADITTPNLNDDGVSGFLGEIIDIFGTETAVALELMSHREKPWMEARNTLAPHEPSTAQISKDTMKEFYRSIGGD